MYISRVRKVLAGVTESKLNMKLLLLSVIVTFCTSVILSAMVYVYTFSSMESITANLVSDLIKQYGKNIETNINELERISFNLMLNEKLFSLLRGGMSPAKTFLVNSDVQENLTAYTNFRTDIIGIYIYSTYGTAYSSLSSRPLKMNYSLLSEKWYNDYCKDTRFGVYFRDSDEQFAVGGNGSFVTFIKNIYDFSTGKKLGAMEIDIDGSIFRPMDESKAIDVQYDLYVVDAMGRYIYGADGKPDGVKDELVDIAGGIREDTARENTWSFDNGKEKRTISYYKSEYTGLTFFTVRESKAIISSGGKMLMVILICAAVISMLLAGILTVFISRKIFLPLRKLQGTMLRIADNNMNERADIRGSDELEELEQIFNSMVDRLHVQMASNIELQREKALLMVQRSKCELDALQSQINPHFLYNTLEVISMTARMNNDTEVQKMAVALGKLLRASIIRDNKCVSLGDEIEHVILYVELQRICFGKGLSLTIDVDEQLKALKVVKFMLQPLVENAVRHGLSRKADARVHIRAETGDGKLNIFVEDNGAGMPGNVMDMVNENLESFGSIPNESGSIGLSNTNKRIQLNFGPAGYGIRVMKSDSTGTVIRIALPAGKN